MTVFQHTATRRWLRQEFTNWLRTYKFQHTATRRWLLGDDVIGKINDLSVSTHSHPKVAASASLANACFHAGFNTQPPEGGCASVHPQRNLGICFNTQPPEGGCTSAGHCQFNVIGFNTQPPEGGCKRLITANILPVCFNTQPPEGGCFCHFY